VLVTLRDVVHELFHPEDTGSISGQVMKGTWQAMRALARVRRGLLYQAGPVVLLMVALTWTVLMVTGGALIYLPWLKDGFLPTPGLPPEQAHGFGTAIYVSLASVTTLAASDVTPKTMALRMAITVESLMGLVIITAWITWVLSIYPVLAERRAFVREIALLRKMHPDPADLLREVPADAVAGVMRSLAEQLLSVGTRLCQTRVTYYFQNEEREILLVAQLPWVLGLGRSGESWPGDPGVRHHGKLLRTAVDQVVGELGRQFVDIDHAPTDEVIAALGRDHLIEDSL
jgi:hypothetical protein